MTKASYPEDHRSRVGAERRQRMRAQLIEAALAVFADHGIEASIDDVIAAAGVARGTFYNYFRTHDELVRALGDTLSQELISAVEGVVGSYDDPVQRIGTGLRLFLHAVRRHPRVAAFIWRAGFSSSTAFVLLQAYLPRRIADGNAAGSLKVESAATGLHVVTGIALAATFALSTQKVAANYPEQIVRHALLALGATARRAEQILALPLPALELPAGSLLARTHQKGTKPR